MTEATPPRRTIRPVGDVIHCRMLEETGKITKGGILIPDTVHARPHQAVVLAIGSSIVAALARGDRVVVKPHNIERVLAEGAMAQAAGTPFANYGEEFLIREEHVLGVITEKPPTFVEIEAAFGTLHAALDQLETEGFSTTIGESLDIMLASFATHFGIDQERANREAVDDE